MIRQFPLLRAKLSPPQPYRQTLARPRVLACLSRALEYRLTVVQAGAGYGKTTALASLWRELLEASTVPEGDSARNGLVPGAPVCRPFWLTLDSTDRQPSQFLAYLHAACEGESGVLALEWEAGGVAHWLDQVDGLINLLAVPERGPGLLILDDFHLVCDEPGVLALTERLLTYLPSTLHVILATRQRVPFRLLPAWRARGEVLELGVQQHSVQEKQDEC